MSNGLLLVDGTGLLVRSQLAVRPEEERRDELALYLFVRSVIRFVKYHDPAYVLIAWDGNNAKGWRQSQYPGYKANRSHTGSGYHEGESLWSQAYYFFVRLGIYQVWHSFEADDIIAWAAWRASLNNLSPVVIRSDDADLNQLICGSLVVQYSLSGDKKTDMDAVIAKYGCAPSHLPLVRALAGDPSDNIPGLPGVGIKTAVKLCDKAGYEISRIEHPSLTINPDLISWMHVYRTIMDLSVRREAVHAAMGCPLDLGALCSWDKKAATVPAVACFERWDMKTLTEQANNGSLW